MSSGKCGHLRTLSLILFMIATVSIGVAQTFGGVIEFQMKSEQGSSTITYFIKGDNMRMEMAGRGGMSMTALFNTKTRTMIMIMPQMKSYMERNMDDFVPQKDSEEKKIDFKKTGKSEKILGYNCDQYILKGENGETEVWATQAFGQFVRFQMRQQAPAASAWERVMKEKRLFPLRVIQHEDSGEEKFRMDATKVEKKDLEASLFQVPEGYSKMDMPPMMGRPKQ